MLTLRRPAGSALVASRRSAEQPILLATFGVPFDRRAAAFAVDSAVESGQLLLVVNVVELPLAPMAMFLGYDAIDDPPELAEALVAPAKLAASLGVDVERLRVKSPHRVNALLDLVAERSPGLLVFGPDRSAMRAHLYRKAANAVRDRAPCLVWLPD